MSLQADPKETGNMEMDPKELKGESGSASESKYSFTLDEGGEILSAALNNTRFSLNKGDYDSRDDAYLPRSPWRSLPLGKRVASVGPCRDGGAKADECTPPVFRMSWRDEESEDEHRSSAISAPLPFLFYSNVKQTKNKHTVTHTHTHAHTHTHRDTHTHTHTHTP